MRAFIRPQVRKCRVGASGYHSPASFHKQDRASPVTRRLRPRGILKRRVSSLGMAGPKLLKMRDFRASRGFPPAAKTRYNSVVANGQDACGLDYFHRHGYSCQTRHWPGQVSCLHAADPSMM